MFTSHLFIVVFVFSCNKFVANGFISYSNMLSILNTITVNIRLQS